MTPQISYLNSRKLDGVLYCDVPTDPARAVDCSLLGQPCLGGTSGATRKSSSPKCFGRGPQVACRAAGKTKKQHQGCFPGGGTFQNLPSEPCWVDPNPCPAISGFVSRGARREKEKTKGNLFAILGDQSLEDEQVLEECANLASNKRKAQKIVKFLGTDRSLKPVRPVPDLIPCGSLRTAVSSMFSGSQLTLADALSIKSTAKVEKSTCKFCKNLQDAKMDTWTKERLSPQEVDEEHLESFAKAFRSNVEAGWNRAAAWMPYVPNGHATKEHSRCAGGNWNEEEFSVHCEPTGVVSSGKFRIVTLFSGYNVSVLTPLHRALYGSIQRKGWLLVGSPTRERLLHLDQAAEGKQWLSFDYEQATDKIKIAYVRRAIEILIDRAEGLTSDEIRCLRVVGDLKLWLDDERTYSSAASGQPMGSPMSFPLLCLINKTVVDLALNSLLERRDITVKEWRKHPCLINGDDLLTKSTSRGDLASGIFREGAKVGLKSNWSKTLSSPVTAEINSTCFDRCTLQKKSNVSALWMGAEVQDVLGFARESALTKAGFVAIVRNNASRLAKAEQKIVHRIPRDWRRALVKDKKIKDALASRPSSRAPTDTNLFPTVPLPDGYGLTKLEEAEVIRQRVRAIRLSKEFLDVKAINANNAASRKKLKAVKCGELSVRASIRVLEPKKPREETLTLKCLADTWERKRKEELARADREVTVFGISSHCSTSPFSTVIKDHEGLSGIASMQKLIKDFYNKRKLHQAPTPARNIVADTLRSYQSILDRVNPEDKVYVDTRPFIWHRTPGV